MPPQYIKYTSMFTAKEPPMWTYIFFCKTKPDALWMYLYNIEDKIYVRKELNKLEPERSIKLVNKINKAK